MNCIFCKNLLTYHRCSLRFDADEYYCRECWVSTQLRGIFSINSISRVYIHLNKKKEILFQDISIGLINLEHNYLEDTTRIGEWKNIASNIELVTYVTIPLSLNLNHLSIQDLRKKVELYLTFS